MSKVFTTPCDNLSTYFEFLRKLCSVIEDQSRESEMKKGK